VPRYVVRSSRPKREEALALERDLNEEQRAVVLATTGPILVIAGAGSGKTRTLTYRAAQLIYRGLDPKRLLLCTFTNRAAHEMVERVEKLIGGLPIRLRWAGTFHHVANLALRRHAALLGLDENYSILDQEDARDLMGSCLAEEGSKLRAQHYPQARLLLRICSMALNRQEVLLDTIKYDAPRFLHMADDIARVIERYAARKRMLGLVDYDDLLSFLHQLLTEHSTAREQLTEGFEHVLVDEYQDTNKLQGEIVDLCASQHGNLTVVGDDAQSIYSFRGAHYANIIDFPKRYPQAKVFKLERNYRSTPEILALANKSIRHNEKQFPKTLQPTRLSGMIPVLLPLDDSAQQADFVCQRLLEVHQEESVPLSQIAVLYRAHSHSMELQIELTRRKIPYRVRSGLRFFEQAHIKDVVAYLRLTHNAKDALAWQRILRTWSGIGRKSAEHVLQTLLEARQIEIDRRAPASILTDKDLRRRLPGSAKASVERLSALLSNLAEDVPLSEMIRQVIDAHYRDYAASAYENSETRIEDLMQLADYAGRYPSLERFLAELALVSGVQAEAVGTGEAPEETLTLTTVHQAKGLEWRCVFVLCLSEGKFPQALAARTRYELEEERRLFYVAATRAKDQLYLCHPRMDEPAGGPKKLQRLSRFVDELTHDRDAPFERWEIEAG
jgi:DNA helicase-2/ATP-dependent DNA helicase PcrA